MRRLHAHEPPVVTLALPLLPVVAVLDDVELDDWDEELACVDGVGAGVATGALEAVVEAVTLVVWPDDEPE
jgi:hypothetical protein